MERNQKIIQIKENLKGKAPAHIKKLLRRFEAISLGREIKVCMPKEMMEGIIEARISGKIFLMQRLINCGRGCKGCPHGPYWYGYYKLRGRTVSFYVGSKLPPRFLNSEKIKIINEGSSNEQTTKKLCSSPVLPVAAGLPPVN